MKVFLSPSNQYSNTWAVGNTNEKAQAIAFADKLQALLEEQGIFVVRADEVHPFSRIDYAQDCDLYIPLHTNACNGKVRGCRLFVYKKKKNTTTELASRNAQAMAAIQKEVDKLGMSREVLVYYDYASWSELTNAAVSGIPAVYSEAIFHDNGEDCSWYFQNEDALAEAYAKGICGFLGVTYQEKAPRKIYRVQVGAFMDRNNARVMVEKLRQAGFVGFVTELAA